MELITPSIGLLFWMTLSFLIVFMLLKKYAWKPILNGLKQREDNIESALRSAKEAKEEMARLKANNEDLLKEARNERDLMLKEAKEIKDKLVSTAESEARVKADAIVAKAMEDIELEKKAAVNELKNQVAAFSLEIAEKVVRQKLGDQKAQSDLVDSLVKEINLS
ncbi:MAG: F0F1 ATP synthase subunit B [Bacteroidetes bacterium]|jgi:F-type H+-transporting ATPase subunit b|nr:F0F1 ATP synthase subunit B [Bacteroidota bacterium]MDA0973589.1 F0F1 ATP synthase subunit B [Bacteroidota bacterium]